MRTCSNCGHSIRDDDRFCASCGAPADARRQPRLGVEGERARRPAGTLAHTSVSTYVHAMRRFWWVLVAGAAIALLAAVSSRYTIQLFPPGLESKEHVTYTSSSRLLVTSREGTHLRYQYSIFGSVPTAPAEEGTDEETEEGGEEAGRTLLTTQAPDINTLVRAANLVPLLIESDQVSAYREREYGVIPGTVSAQGIYAFATGNRFELSEIPVIELVAVAATPEDAVRLADTTAKAFVGWMDAEADAASIAPRDRIAVEQLNSPTAAIPSPGASRTLPVLVFAVVFGAFAVLAILLDRLVAPGSRPRPAEVEALEQRAKVKKTA